MKFVTDYMLDMRERDLPSWHDRRKKKKKEAAETLKTAEADAGEDRSPAAEVRRCFFRAGVTWFTLYEIRAMVAATLLQDEQYFMETAPGTEPGPRPEVVCGLQFRVADGAGDKVTVKTKTSKTSPDRPNLASELTFEKQNADGKPIDYRVVNEKTNEHVVFHVDRDKPDELGVSGVRAKEKQNEEGGSDSSMTIKVQAVDQKDIKDQTTTAAEIAAVLSDPSNKSNFVIHRTLDDVIPGVDTWRITDPKRWADKPDDEKWLAKRMHLGQAWARAFYKDQPSAFFSEFRTKEPMPNMNKWQPNMRVCAKCQALVPTNSSACPYGHPCGLGPPPQEDQGA
jgi:hypothetical protein